MRQAREALLAALRVRGNRPLYTMDSSELTVPVRVHSGGHAIIMQGIRDGEPVAVKVCILLPACKPSFSRPNSSNSTSRSIIPRRKCAELALLISRTNPHSVYGQCAQGSIACLVQGLELMRINPLLQRITRESRIWEKLNHKNIVPFVGVCAPPNSLPLSESRAPSLWYCSPLIHQTRWDISGQPLDA